jgi:hypothetical protein
MNEFKSTAGLLQAVDKLKVYIDKAPIENLHEFEKNLSTVELQMNVNQTAVKKYHAEVEDFLSEYNSIVSKLILSWLIGSPSPTVTPSHSKSDILMFV